MRTRHAANHPSAPAFTAPNWTPAQTVVIVNATPELFESLESTLAMGCFSVVVLDSCTHAHAEIKRLHPNLVVVCISFERPDGFQLLTMLKLDSGTHGIPVVSLMIEEEEAEDWDATSPWPPTLRSGATFPQC